MGLRQELLAHCSFPGEGTEVTCAVSGGADSLSLLVLATAAGCRVTAVHVDHGLRTGSASEAGRVRAAAERYGARFRAEQVTVLPGSNLQARARAARYGVLPADVLTGHTCDDLAETVVLNLLRGAGRPGLAGIRRTQRRPLLGLRRTDTAALCAAEGLEPLQDPTNDDPTHRRTRVRNEVLPLLDDVAGRDVVPVIARVADVMGEESDLLDRLAADLDPTDPVALREADPALARRAIRAWLWRGMGGDHPVDLAAVDRVLEVADLRTRATDIQAGWRVVRAEGRLQLDRVVDFPGVSDSADGGDDGSVVKVEDPHLGRVLVPADELAARVIALGEQITEDYQGRPPLLVGVLKGAFMFMSDLSRHIALPVEFDFMAVSSYGAATRTSGVVRIVKDLDIDLTNRHVLLVEDIVDSGLTLRYLRRNLESRNPASLEVCALLLKHGAEGSETLKYVGFEIPDDFVIGYGLDVAERYRNLPYICAYNEEV